MIYCADDGVLLYPLTFSSLTRGCFSKQLIVGSRVLISVSFLHVPSCVTSHSSLHSFRTTKIMKQSLFISMFSLDIKIQIYA